MKRIRRISLSLAAVASLIGLTVVANTSAASGEQTGRGALDCSPTQQAILDVPHRLFAAWDKADADGIAAVFTWDGHMIPSDGAYLDYDYKIASYYRTAFAGPLKDTRMIGKPTSVRCLSNTTAVVDGLGGLLLPGETYTDPEQVPLGRRIIVSWTAVQVNGKYLMKEFQSTTIKG